MKLTCHSHAALFLRVVSIGTESAGHFVGTRSLDPASRFHRPSPYADRYESHGVDCRSVRSLPVHVGIETLKQLGTRETANRLGRASYEANTRCQNEIVLGMFCPVPLPGWRVLHCVEGLKLESLNGYDCHFQITAHQFQ